MLGAGLGQTSGPLASSVSPSASLEEEEEEEKEDEEEAGGWGGSRECQGGMADELGWRQRAGHRKKLGDSHLPTRF